MITTANASAPIRRGISQCQQDRNDMRQAWTECNCEVGLSDWKQHGAGSSELADCPFYEAGKRIAERKAKVWDLFGSRL